MGVGICAPRHDALDGRCDHRAKRSERREQKRQHTVRHQRRAYDLDDTQRYQAYKGIATEASSTQQAVQETSGEFISYGGGVVEYEGMKSFIRRSDLSRDRAEQRPERFSVGDKGDVRVTNVDAKTRRLGLSIKAREIAEEKEAVEQYGSSDSGASLGDILGAALKGDE